MVIVASALNTAAPLVAFGAFMLIFAVQARRQGKSVKEYLHERNRHTFTHLRPGWWKLPVAFSAVIWAIFWIASGFRPIALVLLPVVVLWIPLWALVFRAYFRRH
jgi:hypothetical protein